MTTDRMVSEFVNEGRLPCVRPVDPIPGPPPRGYGEPDTGDGPVEALEVPEPMSERRLRAMLDEALGVRALRQTLQRSMVADDDEAALLAVWRGFEPHEQAEAMRALERVGKPGPEAVTLFYQPHDRNEAVELFQDGLRKPTHRMHAQATATGDPDVHLVLTEQPDPAASAWSQQCGTFSLAVCVSMRPVELEAYAVVDSMPRAYRVPFRMMRARALMMTPVMPFGEWLRPAMVREHARLGADG